MNISGPLTNPEADQQGSEAETQDWPTLQPVANRTSYLFIESLRGPQIWKENALVNEEPMSGGDRGCD